MFSALFELLYVTVESLFVMYFLLCFVFGLIVHYVVKKLEILINSAFLFIFEKYQTYIEKSKQVNKI